MTDWAGVGTALAGTTTDNLAFLQRNLLDDSGTSIWTAAELYDDMLAETFPFWCAPAMISTTIFQLGKTFVVPKGTTSGYAPELTVATAGTPYATSAYTVDYVAGQITFSPGLSTAASIEATYYACDLYAAAKHAMLRRMNSTAISGEKTSIRLGPLSKSVSGPQEMVLSFAAKINAFSRFSAMWRAKAQYAPRVRM